MLSRKQQVDIASCEDFLCLVTKHWLASRDAEAQLAYALKQGKPIIALIQSGVRLPAHMTHILASAEKHYWSTPHDLQAIMAMLENRHPCGINLVDGPVYD